MEIWKKVKGYEDSYEVSNRGRVRSIPRVRTRADGVKVRRRGHLLTPRIINTTGHVAVALHNANNNKLIHVLVAEAFLGKRPEGTYVLHKNGIAADNRVENLKYGGQSENMHDVYYHGNQLHALDLKDVDTIRTLLDRGTSVKLIADTMGVTSQTIYSIRNGNTYGWYNSDRKEG